MLYSGREQIPRYLKAIQKAGRYVTHCNGWMKILVIRSGYNLPTLFRDLQESETLPSRTHNNHHSLNNNNNKKSSQ